MKYLPIIFLLCCTACAEQQQKQQLTTAVDSIAKAPVAEATAPVETTAGDDETAIAAEELSNYVINTYHYDSTFGTRIEAKVNTRFPVQNGSKTAVTTFVIPDHKFRIESIAAARGGSGQTAFYYDDKPLNSKDENGQPITNAWLNFKDAPFVISYKINNKEYYYVEGTAIEAALSSFSKIVYAFIFDISTNTVYGISTLNESGDCFIKAEDGHLAALRTMPLNGMGDKDSLSINKISLNY
ncbi:hypothetical protein ACE38W_09910 [Chitinophaga sp. Hz27]|uniref:hypothetical protein n=1 Tax=Chitinophaga sp. Hz27 TaxID=3347169 RepID=UPI0035DB0CE5